ncbi:MAG: hypothetical protein ABJE95_12525 [Byssovorax sp.]
MKTENHDRIPESECFEADGHVTDVVVTCLADGETAIIPPAATAHVDACDACTARLGIEALFSVGASTALLASATSESRPPLPIVAPAPIRAVASMVPSSRKRRPLPLGAIAAALCVAVVGALPGLMGTLRNLRVVLPDYIHALPIWGHAIEAVLRGMMASRSGAVLRWITAAVFIGLGTLLARAMTRKRLLEGDVR